MISQFFINEKTVSKARGRHVCLRGLPSERASGGLGILFPLNLRKRYRTNT